MALPAALQALFDRLQTYNSDAYNASTNPGGFARGGNQKPVDNFIKSVRDFTAFGKGISDLTSQAGADAQATAADRVQTGQDREAASTSASAAAQSATDAGVQAARLIGTSNTSQTPSVASKTFTTQAGKAFDVGTALLIQSRSNIDRFMSGRVTAYSGTSLTVSVEGIGSVTSAATDWDIRVSGIRGLQGLQGIPGIATMPYMARTSNTQIVAANSATIFDLTGTFTQTFSACAVLGANWYAVLRNAGTGDITLDPNGSETIDGVTSFIMYPSEVRLIQCDGTALRSLVLQPFYKAFTASDNFIKPPGYKMFRGLAWSGGASGGRHTNTANHVQGGNGGGCFPFDVRSDDLAGTTAITIGAGGAPITSEVLSGNPGGNTSFGSLLTVFGAAKDNGGGIRTSGVTANDSGFAAPSVGGNGYSTVFGGATSTSNSNATGGSSIYGGAGGAPIQGNSNTAGFAGTSVFGGSGGAANAYGKPGDGAAPGGGGGATRSGADASGAGGRGELRIWGVA